MSLRVVYDILNQKGTPAFYSDTLANRPAFGFAGRVFISTDSGQIFEDTGTAWALIADAGVGGGTLETVTTNGNTTDKGIVITSVGLVANKVSIIAGTASQFLKANGTLDNNTYLTSSAAASTFVPYTGATSPVNLGNNGLQAATFRLPVYGNTSGYIDFATDINASSGSGTGIYPIQDSKLAFYANPLVGTKLFTFDFSGLTNSTNRVYTMPDASGTLALTSNLNLYLPLAGGTLTGALSGTNGYFSGNFGIGITPSVLLDLYKTSYPILQISSGSITGNFGIDTVNNFLNIGTTSNHDFVISVNNTESLRVAKSSNILLGTNFDSGQKFQLNGSGYINGLLSIGTAGALINESSLAVLSNGNTATFKTTLNGGNALLVWNSASGSQTQISFFTGSSPTLAGTIATNGVVTTYNSVSDYRLKTDFKDFNGLNIINLIKVYDYKWKNYDSRMFGVIAHELQEILPYAVNGNKDDEKMQQVDYSKIVPALVKAIQELNDKLVKNNIN